MKKGVLKARIIYMNTKVTLKDIAEIAGISINSVSKALRDSPSISKTMKDKVSKIAKELGYVKDLHAISLRGDGYKVVAIVYDNLTNPYYSTMLEIINRKLSEKGYESMIFVDSFSFGHLSDATTKRAISYGVSGVITFLAPTNAAMKLLKNNHIPTVLIGRSGEMSETYSVYSNDYRGGKAAAKALFGYGGKSFAYFTKHSELKIDQQRLAGYKKCLADLGYSLKKEHIIIGDIEVDGLEELEKLLSKEKIDSIFCFSDVLALEVIVKLTELGYKVPEDINVVGYDNIKGSFPYPLQLSSIDTQKEYTTDIALELLDEQLNGIYEPKYLKVDVIYSEGNTTSKK